MFNIDGTVLILASIVPICCFGLICCYGISNKHLRWQESELIKIEKEIKNWKYKSCRTYDVDSQQMVVIERANINPIIKNPNINHSYELKESEICVQNNNVDQMKYNEVQIEMVKDSRYNLKDLLWMQIETIIDIK